MTMKKRVIVLLLITIVLLTNGCSVIGDNISTGDDSMESQNQDDNEYVVKSSGEIKSDILNNLDIDDFRFDVVRSNNSDENYVNLHNETKFDILTVGVTYEYENKHYEFYSEQTVKENESVKMLMMVGVSHFSNGDFILDDYGQDLAKILYMNIDNYNSIMKNNEYKKMTPKRLAIVVISSDNKLYKAYYDYSVQAWWVDSNAVEYSTWPNRYVASLVPKPDGYIFVTDDRDSSSNWLNFVVYDMEEDGYKQYLENVKKKGFVVDNRYPPTITDVENKTETIQAKDAYGNKYESVYAKDCKMLSVDVKSYY